MAANIAKNGSGISAKTRENNNVASAYHGVAAARISINLAYNRHGGRNGISSASAANGGGGGGGRRHGVKSSMA
jgi:hypothetical protein